MSLDRLRAALESFDAGPAGSLDLMRRLADVIEAAREICAASPPDSTTSPQDAPIAALAPKGASMPGEPMAGPSCGAGQVSDELALAAAGHASAALDADNLPEGDELELARRALALPDPAHAVFMWDLLVRAFVAGARWQNEQRSSAAHEPQPSSVAGTYLTGGIDLEPLCFCPATSEIDQGPES